MLRDSYKDMFEEDVPVEWAKILTDCAVEQGSPNFAWNLAERGCIPEDIRIMAERWREDEFTPCEWADNLDLFADGVEELSGSRHRVFR